MKQQSIALRAPIRAVTAQKAGVIQRSLKAEWGGRDDDSNNNNSPPPKKLKEEVKEEPVTNLKGHIHRLIQLVIAHLNTGYTRVPPLSVLVTQSIADSMAKENPGSKRSWQFIAVGVSSFGVTEPTLVEATNNMQELEKGQTETDLDASSSISQQAYQGAIKPHKRQFHAETRLVAHGCGAVGVSGGENCMFCSLYFKWKGRPYHYHTDQIKSWHLPEAVTIQQFFGDAVTQYLNTHGAAILSFRSCPVKSLATTQDVIDLLTATSQMWFT